MGTVVTAASEPSPKLHVYPVIGPPFASSAVKVNVTSSVPPADTTPESGFAAKRPAGGLGAATTISSGVDFPSPPGPVTVSITGYVPDFSNRCVGCAAVSVSLSPKSHRYFTRPRFGPLGPTRLVNATESGAFPALGSAETSTSGLFASAWITFVLVAVRPCASFTVRLTV